MARLTYDEIKFEVESAGWKLLSDSYSTLKSQMKFKCPNDHENYYTMEYWRRHQECPICKSNRYFRMDDTSISKKDYRILALDQASITSGWAVFDGGELIKFGQWTSEGKYSTERIAKTKFWVANMIQIWKPDLVIFEDIQLQRFDGGEQVLVFKKLAHLQGVLKNYCYENGYPYKVVPAATWRASSKIKGKTRNDKKKNAQIVVKMLYDVNVSQDEADAILIGCWAVQDKKRNEIIQF